MSAMATSCVKMYLTDATLYVLKTVVSSVGADDKGRFARLVETIFHPQGGGQPYDIGTMNAFRVVRVEKEGTPTVFDIKHYYEGDGELHEGDSVECKVDVERRKTNARSHSAGHLIAAIAEKNLRDKGVKATAGHHIPGECRVEFEKGEATVDLLRSVLEAELPKAISSDCPVAVIFDAERNRSIKIGEFEGVGCGGTHVSHLAELGEVKLKSVNVKGGKLRVSYEC